jgi:hypothetical protein
MSGSGGERDDYRTSTPIGSSGSPGGGGSEGGGGGGADDPCAIVQTAPINSPNPAVVAGLSVGDILDVILTGAAPRQVLEVRVPGGRAAGSLTHRGHLAIVRCIGIGNSYRAEVIQKTGGSVVVRIERA